MKTEVKVEDLQKLMPSTKSMIYLEIVGVQILLIAFLLLNENFFSPFLLMIGAVVLTRCFEKSRLQNKLKEIIE